MMALAEALRQLGRGDGDPQLLADLGAMMADPQPHLEALPPSRQPLLEKVWPWWSDLLTHPARDQFWQDLSVLDRAEQVTVPALHIGGWFDIFAANTARSFTELRARAGTAEAREGQRLIIGPWDHLNSTGIYPDRRFGLMADAITQDLTSEHLRFFDRWLRGRRRGAAAAPPRSRSSSWASTSGARSRTGRCPTPATNPGTCTARAGPTRPRATGGSAPRRPAGTATDTYLYDPLRPVPTLGGRIMLPTTANAAGAVDQRPAEARDDVLCFTSEVLTEPLEVTGHVSLTLFASSSAPDTDFTGKLVDVFPDGRAIFLTDGILRARYRNSLAEPEPLTPGEPCELSLDLSITSNVFRPGHRIRLEVSSSNFPRFDRNTQHRRRDRRGVRRPGHRGRQPRPARPGLPQPPDPARHPPLTGAARARTPVSTARVAAGSITSSISNAIAVLSALPRAYCSATSSS